jgi:hypothetical protein
MIAQATSGRLIRQGHRQRIDQRQIALDLTAFLRCRRSQFSKAHARLTNHDHSRRPSLEPLLLLTQRSEHRNRFRAGAKRQQAQSQQTRNSYSLHEVLLLAYRRKVRLCRKIFGRQYIDIKMCVRQEYEYGALLQSWLMKTAILPLVWVK